MRRLTLVLILFFAFVPPLWADRMSVTVTQPWLALITSFLGGPNVAVTPLQIWNEEGRMVRAPRPRKKEDRVSPEESRLVALDLRDARASGAKPELYSSFRALYCPFPIPESRLDQSLSDPSVLPFVAQRVLVALSDWDPGNYFYYQRRLAEFQARLSSSVLAGRQILKGVPVYDLTRSSEALLQAAGCEIETPSSSDLDLWSRGQNLEQLVGILDENAQRKRTVVFDSDTPRLLRQILEKRPEAFFMGRPLLDQEYPALLHDLYISMWLKITAKPLPQKVLKR